MSEIDTLKLFQLKYINGYNDQKCAEEMQCSLKTIYRKKTSKEFKALVNETKQELMTRVFCVQHNILDLVLNFISDMDNMDTDQKIKALNVLSKFCSFTIGVSND